MKKAALTLLMLATFNYLYCNQTIKDMTKIKDSVTGKFKTRHGMRFTPEYGIWRGMISRCTNPKTPRYSRYGGRGITVCDRWRNDFINFYNDMGPKPHGLSLDRKENDGNYEPGNCRWATPTEQSNNTSFNVLLYYRGETKSLSQWCWQLNMKIPTVYNRLKRGWSVEDTFTKPVNHRLGIKWRHIDLMPLLDRWLDRHGIQKQYFIHDRILVTQ